MQTNKTDTRLSGMLGFAMRAGKLVLGTEQVCVAMATGIKKKRPDLILIASGTSAATYKKIVVKAEYYGIDCRLLPIDLDELGRLLGKTYAPAALAVVDDGFAKQLRIRLDELGILTATPPMQENTTLRKEVSEKETGMTDGAD